MILMKPHQACPGQSGYPGVFPWMCIWSACCW